MEPLPVLNQSGGTELARPVRRVAGPVVATASLANGAALVLHILGGLALPALLVITWTIAVVSVAGMAILGGPPVRDWIIKTVGVGLAVGLVATVAYDATKAVLSQLDPSPYDPFEAMRTFGRILVGETASPAAIAVSGVAFHVANGCTFAVSYAALLARGGRGSLRYGVVTGLGWGILLETFQLALYPGWLSIRFVDEFRQISFISHLVFGLGLGLFIPAGLRAIRGRSERRMDRSD